MGEDHRHVMLIRGSDHLVIALAPARLYDGCRTGGCHLVDAITPPAPAAPEQALGLDLLPIPAPSYYTTDQLTKRPQPAVLAELETPETRPLVASGQLVLKLWIDDEGRVADVAVEKSDLPEVFSRTAIASFKQSRFLPGERNGQRVGSVMRIEVSYEDRRAAERR